VRGGTVTCREAFTGNDESRGVRPEIEEELGEDVEGEQGVTRELMVSEADDYKEDGED